MVTVSEPQVTVSGTRVWVSACHQVPVRLQDGKVPFWECPACGLPCEAVGRSTATGDPASPAEQETRDGRT